MELNPTDKSESPEQKTFKELQSNDKYYKKYIEFRNE